MSYIKKIVLLLLLVCGCTFTPRNEENNFSSMTGGNDNTGMMSSSETSDGISTTSSTSSSSESDLDTSQIKFDTNIDNIAYCKKIDFLFVIDNSGSMQDNQSNLIENYQNFIDGIVGLTGYEDFHIGIITTDSYQYNDSNCGIIGGLVTKTGGANSSNYLDGIPNCGPWSDGNFMTINELDGKEGFSCAAQVGTAGSATEKPLEAFLASLGPFLNSAGQCNENFFRDDARLIVIFITDEDDGSTGSLVNWLDELEFYKGTLDNIVPIGLVPVPESQCIPGSGATKLKDFITSFPHHALGDICDENYSDFFESALDIIDQACTPVG